MSLSHRFSDMVVLIFGAFCKRGGRPTFVSPIVREFRKRWSWSRVTSVKSALSKGIPLSCIHAKIESYLSSWVRRVGGVQISALLSYEF